MKYRLVHAALLSTLFACGEDAASNDDKPSAAVSALAPDTSRATCASDQDARDLEEHACLHAASGPFADVTASAPAGAPPISKSHTAFEITFSTPEARWVAFQAKEASPYVFYSSPKTRLALRRPNGDAVPLACEGSTTDVCSRLTYQVQAQLQANETVYVALFPESMGPLQLVVERAD